MEERFGAWAETDDSEADITVLHVDDEPSVTDLTAAMLERESDRFDVHSENAPADAIEWLSSVDVDCVVSDYSMPETNGLEFYEQLCAVREALPFILFTGKGSEEVASDAFSLGVTDYLQKESGIDQYTVLANRIERAVSEYRSKQRVELTRRRFKTLVEESNDAILVVDEMGVILYATPSTNRILGRSPDELVGTSGFDPVHDDDMQVVADELSHLIEDPQYRGKAVFQYHHGDGSWVRVELRGRNLLDNEDIAGIVAYVRDLEERPGHS